MAIEPKGILVHSMAEFLKMPEGPMKAHDFLKSVKLSVHGFIHPDGKYEKMVDSRQGISCWEISPRRFRKSKISLSRI